MIVDITATAVAVNLDGRPTRRMTPQSGNNTVAVGFYLVTSPGVPQHGGTSCDTNAEDGAPAMRTILSIISTRRDASRAC